MRTFRVKALITVSGVRTEPIAGMPKSEADDLKLAKIKHDLIIAIKQSGEHQTDVRFIDIKEE